MKKENMVIPIIFDKYIIFVQDCKTEKQLTQNFGEIVHIHQKNHSNTRQTSSPLFILFHIDSYKKFRKPFMETNALKS